jgi:S1-C subfamily serine protease
VTVTVTPAGGGATNPSPTVTAATSYGNTSPGASPSWTASEWLALLGPDEGSVVKITTYSNALGTAEVAGSEFFTHGVIITRDHVVAHAHYYIDVWFPGRSTPYHAYVVAADPAQDLAALRLDDGYDPGDLPLGHMANQVDGEPVAILGHPGGGSLYITPGTLLHQHASVYVSGYGLLSPMLTMQTAAIGGDSGGPVFDTRGHVIGVLEDGTAQVAAQGGAVPVSAVRLFLEENGLDGAASGSS